MWWAGSESNTRHEDFQSSALPTELPAHRDCKCRGFATVLIRTCPDSPLQQPSGCASPVLSTALCGIALLLECRDPRLDEIDHLGLEVGLIQPIDLLDSRGRGHVDLGQVVADDVEPDEIEPVALQARPHHRADLAVARGYLSFDAIAADVDIAAVLVVARDSQRASQRLAVEHDQPLVAVADFGQIALRHYWPRLETGDRLEDCVQVAVVGRGQKHAFAAVSVERLDDHLPA